MNELTEALASGFQVSAYPNNPAAPHPRFASYKQKTPGSGDQYVRRQKILERQKEKRFDYQNLARRLTEGDFSNHEEDEDEEEEGMDVEVLIRKPSRNYKNQLMLSEWMIDKPDDFEENWVMLPCPVGRRSLIIASKGVTSVYSRNGFKVNQFPSHLPGGNRSSFNQHSILDGIYVETEKTFYILDLMSWGNHPVYECETEFRFYWLSCKFQETPILSEIGPQNKFKFIQLPNCPCTKESITQAMATPMNTELDGLLFYHKAAHYLFGPTPLVLWLKPYMLPEILLAEVPQHYLDKKPHEYVCFAHHADKVTAARARKETQRQLAKRGQSTPGRRGIGRVPHSNTDDPPSDSMDMTSPGSDVTSSGTRRGAPSGKGRGRGRGTCRGQGRGQYQGQSQEDNMEDPLAEDVMDVTSSGGRRRRRHNRRPKHKAEGMDTVDCQGEDDSSQPEAVTDSIDTDIPPQT